MAQTTEQILKGLAELVNDETNTANESITLHTSFTKDLDIDSISIMTIVVKAEEKFYVSIPDEQVKYLKTIGDVVDFIQKAQGR